MGFVICDKHDGQLGVLCCDHLADSIYGRIQPLEYLVVEFQIDEHEEILAHHICQKCVKDFNLPTDGSVSEEVWADDENFPYVFPVCRKCFDEYKQKT